VEHKVYGKIKSFFSSKLVMNVIVTGIYRFETPFKTDGCLHNYIAYDTAVGAAHVESYQFSSLCV